MNVLAITTEIPYPPNDGLRLRAWHLLTRLSSSARVTLLTWDTGDPERLSKAQESFHRAIVLPMRQPRPRLTKRLFRQLRFIGGGSVPPYADDVLEARSLSSRNGRSEFAGLVRQIVRQDRIEVVELHEEVLSCLRIPKIPGVALVQHRLNLLTPTLEVLRQGSDRNLARLIPDANAWKRYDRFVQERADLVVAVTKDVGLAVGHMGFDRPVVVAGNGIERQPVSSNPAAGTDVAFVGWMNQPPNIDAVTWFIDDIWSALRTEFPGSTFRIVGRSPSSEVLSLAGAQVHVTGEVNDVAAACTGVRVGVVPLRAGMGIKNKTLELLALGLPVIGTPPACEGISAGHDQGLIVARDAAEFSDKLSWLLSDDEAVARLSAAARSFAVESLGWEMPAKAHLAALAKATSASRSKAWQGDAPEPSPDRQADVAQ